MKKIKSVISIAIVAIIIATCLAGCSGSKNEQTTSTAILIQNTQNISLPNIRETSIYSELLSDLMVSDSRASVFELDGLAYEVDGALVKADIPNGISNSNKKTKAKGYANKIVNVCNDKAIPKTEEVDYLYGISTAARFLKDSNCDNMKLNIIGTGLSTKGQLNFKKSPLYCDMDNYIDYLSSESQLPNLSGIEVDFYLAQADGVNQELLENKDIKIIEYCYDKLFKACGTTVTFHEMNASSNIADSSFPSVSTVEIRHESFDAKPNEINITLEEETTFKSNSCDFVNEAKTEESLRKLVDTINNSSSKTLIFGSTAYTDSNRDVHLNFAMKRAETICNKLIELGVDSNKLKSYSLGKEQHPYRTNDSGKFSTEANHNANRIVMIVSADTEKGKTLEDTALKYSINR